MALKLYNQKNSTFKIKKEMLNNNSLKNISYIYQYENKTFFKK